MAASPPRLPRAPEAAAAAAAAAKGDPGQQPRKFLPRLPGSFASSRPPAEASGSGKAESAPGRPGSPSRASLRRRSGTGIGPRSLAREPRQSRWLAEAPAGHVTALPAASWRRGGRAVGGSDATRAPARDPRREQDGGQGEEEEGEHLGPLQVHRQDHPREVPGRPGSQRRPERFRPAAQPGAGWHHRVHERSG